MTRMAVWQWILVLALIGVGAMACDDESANGSDAASKDVSAASERPAAKLPVAPMPEPEQVPESDLQPPPLAPALQESGTTLEELIDQARRHARQNRKDKPPKLESDPTVLYRWTDITGRTHVASHIEDVPPAYRDQVEEVERVERPASAGGSSVQDYDPEPFRADAANQERQYEAWRTRWLAARENEAKARRIHDDVRDAPPDCGNQAIPGVTAEYDPDCRVKYERRLKRLNADVARAAAEVAKIREEARKAGVPPGYFR